MLFPKIISIEAVKKYILKISFNDGVSGVYDVSDLRGKGVFKLWDEEDNFFKVFINDESGAVSWPGEMDIDTLNAYCSIKGISPNQFFHKKIGHAGIYFF